MSKSKRAQVNIQKQLVHQARKWRRYSEGKTGLYIHFGGVKALSSYVNLQVKYYVGGKTTENFLFGTCLLCTMSSGAPKSF